MTFHSHIPLRRSARHPLLTPVLTGALVLATLCSLQGCVLLVGAGAVGGSLVMTDRRTSGTQLDDESIEMKSGGRIHEVLGDRGHVSVTSYNRLVLVTGEVPTPEDKAAVEKSLAEIQNVASIQNELEVGFTSSITSRSNDTYITGKVKSAFIDAKDLQSNAIKVVTERGIVYLMGRVTEREAARAAEVARNVGGVVKVVRVFDILSEAQVGNLTNH